LLPSLLVLLFQSSSCSFGSGRDIFNFNVSSFHVGGSVCSFCSGLDRFARSTQSFAFVACPFVARLLVLLFRISSCSFGSGRGRFIHLLNVSLFSRHLFARFNLVGQFDLLALGGVSVLGLFVLLASMLVAVPPSRQKRLGRLVAFQDASALSNEASQFISNAALAGHFQTFAIGRVAKVTRSLWKHLTPKKISAITADRSPHVAADEELIPRMEHQREILERIVAVLRALRGLPRI
jgi:hypothetical protein